MIASARDQLQIAGSSTVLPYATIVAEAFGENTDFKTPVVEGGGSGAGRQKFCQGVGEGFIDIANPAQPQPAGFVPVDGEPTSVVFAHDKVLAVVSSTRQFDQPEGHLAVPLGIIRRPPGHPAGPIRARPRPGCTHHGH